MARAAHKPSSAFLRRLRRVKLLLCDVDGVLTDGTVLLGDGKEYKAFNIQDGLGMILLMRHGIKVGWISNRPSAVTEQRASELHITHLVQGKMNKVEAVEAILQQEKLAWEDACYMGDDVVDLGALKRAGAAVAVANAIDEAKEIAHYVTRHEGGTGAVREIVTLILRAQDKWKQTIEHFSA